MDSGKQLGITNYHRKLFLVCFLSIAVGGVASTLVGIYLPRIMEDLLDNIQKESPGQTALVNAAFVFGWSLGGFCWGWIGDRSGRKKALLFSTLCYSLCMIASAGVTQWWTLVICRLLTGFGMGGVLVSSTTIMVEEWEQRTKAIFVGVLSIAMPVGIFLAGWIAAILPTWRECFLIGIIPLILSFGMPKMIRESVQWKTGKFGQSNDVNLGGSIFSFNGGRNLALGSVIFGAMLIGLWAIFSWLPIWVQSLPSLLPNNSVGSRVMIVFGAGGLTGGFLSGWLLNALGSKKSLLLCYAACFVSSFMLFKTNSTVNLSLFAECAVLAVFFGASQGVLSVYIPELFPVSIRARATGFCFNVGRLCTAVAVLFVGLLQSALGGYGNAMFAFSMVFVLGFIATMMESYSPALVTPARTLTEDP